MDVCTIVWRRDLARVRVLARTLREQTTHMRLTLLILDGDASVVTGLTDACVLALDDVATGAEWGMIAATNPPGAMAMALLPALLKVVLERDGGDGSLAYLGPGERVLGPLDELQRTLGDHQTVLVARVGSHVVEGSRAGELGSVFAGELAHSAFSRETIAFRKGPAAAALLDAWPRCFADRGDDGAAAVARWLDEIPAISEDVGILRDAGYGLDPLTLGARPLASRNGLLEVNGRPARLLDLGEFDPLDPPSCFEGDGRARLSTKPTLAALVSQHAADLLAAGHEQDAILPLGLDRLADGTRLTATVRALAVEAIRDGAQTRSPFTQMGRQQLYAYLNTLADSGRAAGLTRLHLAIWQGNEELRQAYPHLQGPDGSGFAGWLCTHGSEQEGLAAELLPPAPDLSFRDADPFLHRREARWGVNVAGFFTSELGVGEAARLLFAGLDARSIPALAIQGDLAPPSGQGAKFVHARPDDAPYPINIICINGDGIPVFAREAGRSFFAGRHTVALWWWEVGDPPANWNAAYEFVDEVWVASEHIYDAIAPRSPVPVVRMTLPVVAPTTAAAGRAQLGLPEEGFLFLYVHDYHSVMARKNPDGLISAFRRAFAPGSGAKLVIKSINAATRPHEHERIVLAASGHPDILLIDGYVPAAEKNAMIAHCDCYVSLHRSEGFGLTVAEAMLLQRPVIATRYGGTQDFLDESNAYLVDWEPVPVGEGAFPYPADGIWADPDLDQAASRMRTVFDHPDQAHERAMAGYATMLRHHSPQAAGAAMERRLRYIYEQLVDAGADATQVAHLPSVIDHEGLDGHLLEERITTAPRVVMGANRLAKARRKVVRPLLAWARKYIEHQEFVQTEMQREIMRLDKQLKDVARTLQEQQQDLHAQDLAELRRMEAALAEFETPYRADAPDRARPAKQ